MKIKSLIHDALQLQETIKTLKTYLALKHQMLLEHEG